MTKKQSRMEEGSCWGKPPTETESKIKVLPIGETEWKLKDKPTIDNIHPKDARCSDCGEREDNCNCGEDHDYCERCDLCRGCDNCDGDCDCERDEDGDLVD